MTPLYFDHNATTPLDAEVARAMAECAAQLVGNPASAHQFGQRARIVLEETREATARLLGANVGTMQADQLIFTSGGTEANNLAIFGLLGSHATTQPGQLIVSAVEHPSVVGPAEWLAKRGWQVDRLPVDLQGVARLDALESLLTPSTRLVSLMLGNNETGALQPVAEVARRLAKLGVPLHVDAVQAAGKLVIDFRELGATALSISAHKLHGPVGCGAVVKHGTPLEPQLHGGFQQAGLRPGTESIPLAVGLYHALRAWDEHRIVWAARLQELRELFENNLQSACPEIEIVAAAAARLPQTSSVALVGVDRQALLIALDLAGVACSTGSACASGSSEPSPTLIAMGCRSAVLESALRFSFGRGTTRDGICDGSERIIKVYKQLRSNKSARK